MIFAFDIDETVIFSEEVLSRSGIAVNDSRLRLVDDQFGRKKYAFRGTYDVLRHALTDDQLLLVPCTARCWADCQSIDKGNLEFDWVITSLGTMIWNKGMPFMPYVAHLKSIVSDKEMKRLWRDIYSLSRYFNHVQLSDRYAIWGAFDKENDMLVRELKRLEEKFPNFEFYFEESEISILPKGLNKGYAVSWLKNYLCRELLFSVGDSKYDTTMFAVSDMCFVPKSSYGKLQFLSNASVVRLKSDVDCILEALNLIWQQYSY